MPLVMSPLHCPGRRHLDNPALAQTRLDRSRCCQRRAHKEDDPLSRAVDEGAAAVIVSNHGGRQLMVFPLFASLPEVVAALDGQRKSYGWWCSPPGSDII